MLRKTLAVTALAFAGTFAFAPAASAYDYDYADGGGDTYAVINGDVLSELCAAPWNWEGPLNILTASGPYAACIKGDVDQ
ncbi:hypothetical protein RIF23_00570 [Lipingzhangella sp. LS1_29]|uniref:Secreted protein n=1 Tax=Lipingzhangella rawalii TaxID=2055835 RepID=A0ABU2H0E8_9ACTN|nr:hypothetical protein [Lipingzhangella rawalii]MDS1268782.1 hypothetical protein [Lipingzhangella rawalii]